jgi:hypothetical protein
VNPTSAGGPPLPTLRLPLGRRRLGPGAALALVVHAAIVGALVVRGRELLRRPPGSPGTGGARPAVNFFTLPAAAPAVIPMAAPPRLSALDLSALRRIQVELPPLQVSQPTLPAPAPVPTPTLGGAVGGGGGGGGANAAAGAGTSGAGPGSGTGGEGGYIVPAHPRRVIPRPPACVSQASLRLRFWVAADGRATRVEVEPPPKDDGCRRELVDLMMETLFYPATQNGQPVASVFFMSYSHGN